MKFSENWLREWVNPDINTDELCAQLTMAGLEVDGVEAASADISDVVVAEVKTVEPHPEADKLTICQVDNGKEELTIVCGAPNVRQGLKTALANVGASLPAMEKLKPANLKGVTSNGMLCSARELGLGEDHDGILELPIDFEVGTDVKVAMDANDQIIEISLTPNRGDCLSIKGIAREVAVLKQLNFKQIEIDAIQSTSSQIRNVRLEADDACARYCGRVIESIDASVATPLWLKERLRRSGVRDINIIVDITNYVMLELGQPMHAFDQDKLNGDIAIRYATEGEEIQLLDESHQQLQADTLLIADESGPIAMAGIMGGQDSAVLEDSNTIFLESAFFLPEAIIGKARQYGLHTDSSHRFERGVDPQIQTQALERATALIIEYCGGNPGPVTEQRFEAGLPSNPEVILRKKRVTDLLGEELSECFIEEVLDNLEIEHNKNKNQWVTKAPSHRFDIKIEADLIEELIRIHGYNEVKPVAPLSRLSMKQLDQEQNLKERIRSTLVNREYQEIISYSFIDPELNKLLKSKEETMFLANPISPDLAEMRTSLWPGLITTLQYNLKRQQNRIRLFETGLVFQGMKDLKQSTMLAGCIYGNKYKKQWDINNSSCDLYDIKKDVECLLATNFFAKDLDYAKGNHPILHPGQCVSVKYRGHEIALFGQLHPQVGKQINIANSVYLFEIYMENILSQKEIRYQPISRFPLINRDIAVVIDDDIQLKDVLMQIQESATNLLINLELFDVYHGEGIEKGKKSLALGLTFQATSSTLKDEEVEAIMDTVLAGLNNKFGAKLRE
ncbi:MAG: phenylalanine--tRNA ligase subunit beta [Pseudomonadota bacterium]